MPFCNPACEKFRRYALMACGAMGMWLGFANDLLVFPPLALLWPASLVFLGQSASRMRDAFFGGWFCGFLGAVPTLYWLCFPVRDVGKLPWPLAVLCAIFICACLSVQSGVFSAIALRIRRINPLARVILLILAWYLLELVFALCLGFPWLALSASLAQWPMIMQPAALLGANFTAALWLGALLACLLAFQYAGSKMWACLGFGLVLGATMLVYGKLRLPPEAEIAQTDVQALFVEGNIDQNQKWLPQFQRESLDKYLDLTEAGLAEARANGMENPLIIWPETALPFFFETRPALAGEVRSCAINAACPLLFGAPGFEKNPDLPEGAVFNRAFLLAPNGNTIGYYDKVHLVPFGEYLPEWLNLKFLEALLQGVGIYQEGKSAKPLVYPPLALGMLICYEGIFPWLAQARVEAGANILVDISNDGWFRDSPASRQHLYLTVLRCLEQNRWLLRATNTGISAVVDNYGRITERGPMFRAGWMLARARIVEQKSVYNAISPWLPWICGLLFFLLFAFFARRKPG